MKPVSAEAMAYGWTKCRGCAQLLPLAAFGLRNRERHVRCDKCRAGMRDVKRKYRRKYPATVNRGASYDRNTAIIAAAKAVPCHDCGMTFPAICMDFDHRPDCQKETEVATLRSATEDRLRAEIAKCDVVCCCCHRIRTAARGHKGTGRPRDSDCQKARDSDSIVK